jgi:hypothetical protein
VYIFCVVTVKRVYVLYYDCETCIYFVL